MRSVIVLVVSVAALVSACGGGTDYGPDASPEVKAVIDAASPEEREEIIFVRKEFASDKDVLARYDSLLVILGPPGRSPSLTPTPTPVTDRASAEPVDLGAWAASTCAAAEAMSEADGKIGDGADISALTLDERKARAEEQIPQMVSVARAAARQFDVRGPSETSTYTSALVAWVQIFGDALERQLREIQEATSLAELDASNVRLITALNPAANDFFIAADALSPAALVAINGASRCGTIRN